MSSPGTASSSANSPEKQLKSIPQQPQASGSGSGAGGSSSQGQGQGGQQGQGQAAASASSPAISSGGTTNTPAMANTSLKRKQAGDAASPTVGNSEQPAKRMQRKRGRNSTTGPG